MTEGKLRAFLSELRIPVLSKGNNDWLSARCPFAPWTHFKGADRNPGFGIHINAKGFSAYKCFTCKMQGNLIALTDALAGYRNESYLDLRNRILLEETSISFDPWEQAVTIIETPKPLVPAIFAGLYPNAEASPEAVAYLLSRNISLFTAKKLGLLYDREDNRIIVPVYDAQGQLFGFNGRTILPQTLWPRASYAKSKDYAGLPKQHCLLGIHLADPTKPFLVVEGLFALLKMFELGVDEWVNPVATFGANLSKQQAELLTSYGKGVFLLYDNDTAGEDGLYGTLDVSGKRMGGGAISKLVHHVPTFLPLYPFGVDDPDYLTREQVYEMITKNFTVASVAK